MKVFLSVIWIVFSVALVTAQNRYRTTSSKNRNEPVEQGRTLGLLRPLFGLTSILGYDEPIGPYRPARQRPSAAAQSDSYYGGYNYPSNGYYGGYNPYYGGYPGFSYGYRPQPYPGNYGGYPPNYPSYAYQRPSYSNSRPSYQNYNNNRPIAGPSSPVGPSSAAAISPGPASGAPGGNISPEQAAQVANLLGQLLGSQLRPLIGGASSDAVPNDVSSKFYG